MTHRTLLVLDVDGVLSPNRRAEVGDRPWDGWGGWTQWRVPRNRPRLYGTSGPRASLRLSSQMGAALAGLPADLAWLTTWRHLANRTVCGHFGWPPLPVIDWDPGPRFDHRRKAQALSSWLDERAGRWDRIVWVDDELRPGGVLHPDRSWPFSGRPLQALAVGPDPAVGLTVAHVDDIAAFAAG